MARHRDHMSGWLWVLPSLAIPLVISAAAWTTHVSSHGEHVAPNVRFAGIDVSGVAPEVAAAHVSWRETDFLQTRVTIDIGRQEITMDAAEIGFDYLNGATVNALVSARHSDTAWEEFASWVSTPFQPLTVEDQYMLDEEKARDRLSAEDFVLEFPVEPELADTNGTITVTPGTDGLRVDIDSLVDALKGADIASGSVDISAEHSPMPPSMTNSEAGAVAETVNEMTEHGLAAAVGLTARRLSPAQLRQHVSSDIEDGRMVASIDTEGLQEDLETLFPEQRGDFEKPVLQVVDGVVDVIQVGVPPPVCCTEESVQAVASRLLDGGAPIYLLDTRPTDDERMAAWAEGSQVTEVVAEFTTHHPCCESRVTNIQTMADQVTGYYMLPGETLSFNDFIGVRTREKGYVPAGAIRGGYMTDEVGGGVSQFVTTMFNAAFFGGLELDEYQSHSVYFSRYPYGREATLSIPGPDLVFTNSTDYPVLIWPTYDDTSITVKLYSTPHIEVEELEQRISRRGQCRHSEIDRQRTYPDGRTVVDTIEANYRPGEGIDCNGNVIPRRD